MASKEQSSPSNWIAGHADALFSYAIVRVGDRETAKDLVQETFLSALRSRASFRGESSEKTWLFSILKNKIIDHYRRGAAGMIVPLSDAYRGPELDAYFDPDGEWKESSGPADWKAAGQDDLSVREFQEILRKCLARLTPGHRAVFTLKYLEDLDSGETCKQLGISASNYWVMMHRAKLALRECIEKNWLWA